MEAFHDLPDLITRYIAPHVAAHHLVYQDDKSFALEVHHHDGQKEILRVTLDDISDCLKRVRLRKGGIGGNGIHESPLVTGEARDISTRLCNEYPILGKAWPRVNVVGDVQSGKSRFMMASLWVLTYVHGLQCVLVLMNMVESYNQVLLRDVVLFNQWLRENGEHTKLLRIKGLRGQTGVVGDSTTIRLCMGNAAQLRKVTIEEENVAIVCDEADTLVKHWDASMDTTKSGVIFQACVERAKSVWNITATPFALLNQVHVESLSWRLPKSPLYRGMEHFCLHLVDTAAVEKLRKDDAVVAELVESVCVEASVRGRKPYLAVLVNVRSTHAAQKALARTLARTTGRASYIINSESPCFIKQCDQDGNVRGTVFKTVSMLFDSFEDQATDDVYREHILIANRTANRAVSFRPSPLVGAGGLGAEILLPGKQTHCASLLQSLRLSGNYAEDYPDLHLYVSEEAWTRILGEQRNLSTWVEKNSEWGAPREQIEGQLFQAVGLHDRAMVDDTMLEDRRRLTSTDFDSVEALEAGLPTDVKHLPRVWMTEAIGTVENTDFVYTTDRKEQNRWNRQLKPNAGSRLQICWNEARYHQLHDIRQRFGNKRRQYLSRYLVGDGVTTDPLYRVTWKPEFTSDQLSMEDDDFWNRAVYLFHTSRGCFRFYHGRCGSLATGRLVHKCK